MEGILLIQRWEKLACVVFHVLSHTEESVKVRCSQLCKLLFSTFGWVFYAFVILCCCIMGKPGEQKQQFYINKETSRSKVPTVIENQVSFQNFIIFDRKIQVIQL